MYIGVIAKRYAKALLDFALENGAVRRLFLAAPEISACTLLLQEKLPDGGALIRREAQSVPERPGKAVFPDF